MLKQHWTDIMPTTPACSVCNQPATNATRNMIRVVNPDGTINYKPDGGFYWRCDKHKVESDITTVGATY